ncbi:unnamed protein product [Prunus armeniaca]
MSSIEKSGEHTPWVKVVSKNAPDIIEGVFLEGEITLVHGTNLRGNHFPCHFSRDEKWRFFSHIW